MLLSSVFEIGCFPNVIFVNTRIINNIQIMHLQKNINQKTLQKQGFDGGASSPTSTALSTGLLRGNQDFIYFLLEFHSIFLVL